ncbi:MAG TPA: hypothetical protein P5555_19315 [Candidatus Paceibacterota bacterium]|nr:hypothetical protein [Verrucomicrobiota bacterium]HOX04415.1 hypothetical protein [Verrucomicrobiota bacterium]HRZ47335.1 hypothetical protein [Candidatus Paceibacterota bacterium]HRZ93371.1 hypothetical protein [Candidatus Paceibacterota bacterium]
MPTIHIEQALASSRCRLALMRLRARSSSRLSCRGRVQDWQANMALRHRWFRVLLHLCGMARCPRHVLWHWRHIRREWR